MNALFGDRWRCNTRPDRPWQGGGLTASPMVLVCGSARVPPQLLERLRIAAPPLGLRSGEIAATALDRFLTDYRL